MKLSVITTVYNGAEYLTDLVPSVLNQTYSNFEWIIVDDGSIDNTWELLNNIKDNRVLLIKINENRGVGFASQLALSISKGEFIAKVDADDISELNRFEIQLNYLENHREILLVDSFISYFPHNKVVAETERFKYIRDTYTKYINRPLHSEEISEELFWGCIIINSAMMVRKKAITTIGYEKELTLAEDYQLFYQMNKEGMKFYKYPEKLVNVRISESSLMAQNKELSEEITKKIKMQDLKQFICDSKRPLAIWGAGQYGRETLKQINNDFSVKIEVFLDSNEKLDGDFIEGCEIKYPTAEIIKKYKIIVASQYREEIVAVLKKLKLIPIVDYYVY